MTKKQKEQYNVMLTTLRRIAGYQTVEQLRSRADIDYGLDADEAIVYAYENMQAEATSAAKGIRAIK